MDTRADILTKNIILLSKYIKIRGNKLLEQYDLTPSQFFILVEVYSKGNISQQEIANELKVTEGNISHIVHTLERKNLAKRIRDKKCLYLQLTESSKKLIETLLPEHQKLSESYFQDLSQDEFDSLEKAVGALIGTLK